MRISKKKISIIALLMLLTSFSLTININAITIGDTSVGVNEGDVFTWIVTQAEETSPQYQLNDKLELTIYSISSTYNGVPLGYLYVNATVRQYDYSENKWIDYYSGPESIFAYNDTLKDFDIFGYALIFFLPTPINLTFICEYMNASTSGTAIEIGTNGLYITYLTYSYYYTFNTNGITTSLTLKNGTSVLSVLTLEISTPMISFGWYFMLFITITMFSLVIVVRKRKFFVR